VEAVNHRSIVPPDSALYGTLHDAAAKRRCVFFAGLPGVGKSLLLQQISLIAEHIGRRAHLLQWDVSRGPFETPEILARYPEVDGVTHAVIRKAAGLWAREAVGAWQQQHPAPGDLLIGEVPLIGNRLIELVQRHDDAVEPLLASERTLFLIPVPSRAVREVIEAARVREMASPTHERERANAVPSLVQSLWEEVAGVARELGVSPTPQPLRGANIGCATGKGPRGRAALRADVPPPFAGEGEPARIDGEGGFDPEVYAGVYARLLRHRHAARLDVTTALPVQASVYDALGTVHELMPSPDEVARVMAEVGARPEADVEREVADWYQV
jgi:hypothetical protein